MSQLRLQLFGTFRVSPPSGAGAARLGRPARSLLAFLALYRRRLHARDVLAGMFWGEATEGRARSCLSTSLWRLRQVLEPPGTVRGSCLVTTAAGEVGFNAGAGCWLDVAVFEEAARRSAAVPFGEADAEDAARLEGALALCEGELLEGFYDEWALAERERFRRLRSDALSWLVGYHGARGHTAEAVAFGREALRREPAREEVHRELMRLHLAAGQRSLAARQYELCREALARHFGADPSEETRALYEGAIRGSERRPASPAPAGGGLTERLEAAIRRFDDARDELRRAVDLVLRAGGEEAGRPGGRSGIFHGRSVRSADGEGRVTDG